MVNGNFFGRFGGRGRPINLGVEQFPTQYEPPRVSPTREFVQTNEMNTIVPHIHPSHLTTINQQNIQHQHYFPHTQSVVNQCTEEHVMCGQPFHPMGCGCNRGNSRRRGW